MENKQSKEYGTDTNAAAEDIVEEKDETVEETEQTAEKAEEKTDPAEAEKDVKEPEQKKHEGKEKKTFGRKKEKKDKKDEKIEELTDKLTRQLAEFDNYRKRTEKEKAANYIVGAKEVIEKILPVVDNFERGLNGADLSDPFADGMNKIYKQLTQVLTDIGVTPIEAVGQPFDPNLHNAVMQVEDENFAESTVAEEFQKGYMYKDQVLRYSMVKVAN